MSPNKEKRSFKLFILITKMWRAGRCVIVLCCFILIEVSIAGEVGDKCSPTEEILNGTCALLTDCKDALRLVETRYFHPYSRCGFSGLTEIVCCPNPPRVADRVGDKCSPTEEILNGTCALLTDCKDALRLVETKYFHPYSRCGFSGLTEIVCCPNPPRVADRECQKIMNTTLPSLSSHIIGGSNASLGEFPHMVLLGYDLTGEYYDFRCGGSLISESFILTAAHCVSHGMTPEIARMGVVDIGDGRFDNDSDVRIQQAMVHPNYTKSVKYNDIALLKLERPVKFSPGLSPICLYTKDDDPSINLIVTGWGKTNVLRSAISSVLQKAHVVVVSLEQCRKAHPAFRRLPDGITERQICAGDPQGHHDACQGDSGGPLQGLTSDDGFLRLVAVTSFGRGCAVPGVPGVYTRVASYLDWIESVVWPTQN